MLRVQGDILNEIDKGKCVFLVLLDLSAALDNNMSHHILQKRLANKYGVTGEAAAGYDPILQVRHNLSLCQAITQNQQYSDTELCRGV